MALKPMITAIALFAMITPTQAQAKPSFKGLVLAPHFYHRLAKCETGSDWKHETKSYTSGFGIARGVWQRYSNSSSASRYTPQQQAIVADRIMFLGFEGNPPVGAYGFGVVKNNCMNLQRYICKSKKEVVKPFRRNC
jgi:hypothetical protein